MPHDPLMTPDTTPDAAGAGEAGGAGPSSTAAAAGANAATGVEEDLASDAVSFIDSVTSSVASWTLSSVRRDVDRLRLEAGVSCASLGSSAMCMAVAVAVEEGEDDEASHETVWARPMTSHERAVMMPGAPSIPTSPRAASNNAITPPHQDALHIITQVINAESSSAPPPLPNGWAQYVDRQSGLTYWHNLASNQTVWRQPLTPSGSAATQAWAQVDRPAGTVHAAAATAAPHAAPARHRSGRHSCLVM
mgnify:CR=1 FL=1|jgi:hypothetical protein